MKWAFGIEYGIFFLCATSPTQTDSEYSLWETSQHAQTRITNQLAHCLTRCCFPQDLCSHRQPMRSLRECAPQPRVTAHLTQKTRFPIAWEWVQMGENTDRRNLLRVSSVPQTITKRLAPTLSFLEAITVQIYQLAPQVLVGQTLCLDRAGPVAPGANPTHPVRDLLHIESLPLLGTNSSLPYVVGAKSIQPLPELSVCKGIVVLGLGRRGPLVFTTLAPMATCAGILPELVREGGLELSA